MLTKEREKSGRAPRNVSYFDNKMLKRKTAEREAKKNKTKNMRIKFPLYKARCSTPRHGKRVWKVKRAFFFMSKNFFLILPY